MNTTKKGEVRKGNYSLKERNPVIQVGPTVLSNSKKPSRENFYFSSTINGINVRPFEVIKLYRLQTIWNIFNHVFYAL